MPTQAVPSAFERAVRATLDHLGADRSFDGWYLARPEGDMTVILDVEGDVGVAAGDRLAGGVLPGPPRVVVAVTSHDGRTIGTLCGVVAGEPEPSGVPPFLELLARLLGAVADADAAAAEERHRADLSEREATTDALTGLGNRRGWDRILSAEEARCRRFGSVASVLVVDLDGLKSRNDRAGHDAGDELLRSAAQAIRRAVRLHDVVARTGGDEFAVLAVECDAASAAALLARVKSELAAAEVSASVGYATRDDAGLGVAFMAADAAMYAAKRRGLRAPAS